MGWDAPHEEFVRQVDDTLELLGELDVRATFFVLGMTARNHPGVVDRIAAEEHEIACHGWAHVRAWTQSASGFRRDVEQGLAALDRLGIPAPSGYRAPAFSLTKKTPWAFGILAELGFRYDSSHYDSPRIPGCLPAFEATPGPVIELPIAVARIRGRRLPVGGGSYWRVLPRRLIRNAVSQLAVEPGFPVLYFHPYELGRAPLRLTLPHGSGAKVRARAAWKTVRYNPGRGRVSALLTETAERLQLVSCKEALAHVELARGSTPPRRLIALTPANERSSHDRSSTVAIAGGPGAAEGQQTLEIGST